MKKILLLSQFFYPDRTGTGKILAELFFSLNREKFKVNVVSSCQEYADKTHKVLPSFEEKDGVRIFRSFRWFATKDRALGRIYTYVMVFLCSAWTCIRYGLVKKKEIIISGSNPPIMPLLGVLLKRRRQKFIYILHDLYPDIAIAMHVVGPTHLFSRVMFLVNRYVFQHADKIVVLGRDMKQHLQTVYQVPDEKLSVITNWASNGLEYVPASVGGHTFRILYTGNMGRFHNLELAVEAVTDLSGVELIFVGEGASKASLQKKCRGLSNVKFYPFLEDDDYCKILASADALLVSLEANLSGLAVPSKFYTYLAVGRPVLCISDDNTEMAITIKESQCGFVIGHADVLRFRQCVYALQQDDNLAKCEGIAARQLFLQHYQKEQIVAQYERLFNEL